MAASFPQLARDFIKITLSFRVTMKYNEDDSKSGLFIALKDKGKCNLKQFEIPNSSVSLTPCLLSNLEVLGDTASLTQVGRDV